MAGASKDWGVVVRDDNCGGGDGCVATGITELADGQ